MGKLQFICAVVRPGRVFISRVLHTLRNNYEEKEVVLDDEFKKDIYWWKKFLPDCNGVGILWMLHIKQPNRIGSSDACLEAMGAVCGKEYIKIRFPPEWRGSNIANLELLAIIVMVKTWGEQFKGKSVLFKCDNEAVVNVVNTGRARDCTLLLLMRELVFVAAQKFEYRAVFLPGRKNILPDILSRWHESQKLRKFCLDYKLPPIPAQGMQLRRFAQYLADTPTTNAIETINNYLWGVKTFHRLLDLPPPDTHEFLTTLTLRGLRLTLARLIRQAEPIDPTILERLLLQVDIKVEEQLTAWTALVLAFNMLLRKSNLVPQTQKEFNPEKQLARYNVCLAQDAALIDIVWCKTLQFREKVLQLPLVRLQNRVLCPVFWLWKMIKKIPAAPTDPVFCYHRKNKFMMLMYPRLTFWFKKWLQGAGYDSTRLTMHSCRRGGGGQLTFTMPTYLDKL